MLCNSVYCHCSPITVSDTCRCSSVKFSLFLCVPDTVRCHSISVSVCPFFPLPICCFSPDLHSLVTASRPLPLFHCLPASVPVSLFFCRCHLHFAVFPPSVSPSVTCHSALLSHDPSVTLSLNKSALVEQASRKHIYQPYVDLASSHYDLFFCFCFFFKMTLSDLSCPNPL